MDSKNLKKELEAHAKTKGFKLNPNERLIKVLINKLIINKQEKGEYYCPCRIDFLKEFICPCLDHEKQVKEDGHCHCFLFVK